MTHRLPRRRRIFLGALSAAVAGAGLTLAGPVTTATAAPGAPQPGSDDPAVTTTDDGSIKTSSDDGLSSHDQELLDEALERGERWTTLIIATEPGDTEAVESRIDGLGGVVGNRVDEVGYVRATVPTKAVTATAAIAAVDAVDLDETIAIPDPVVAERDANRAVAEGPGPGTPDSNAYMPTYETGAVAFKKRYPRYDGRGVTIGIIDSGVDLDHPALQQTSTGERKIVDWVTGTDPLEDPSWRAMRTAVSGPSFSYAGGTWTAPEGDYLVNRFSESITAASEPEGDVNRDGDTTDQWGVLYDPATHDIWVDVDQDLTFADDELMRPYNEDYQVGHFGTDDAATELVEQMPFVVEFREDVDLTPAGLAGETSDFVNIGIVESAHGSHVAGITAANEMFGGDMDGAAPGAKLVSTRACSWGGGCTAVALTDGMMDLVLNRGVDVVNMSIGGLPALNDGNNARAELYNRLIDISGVQLFISAGNSGPGLNTVGDPSVASDVVSVGSSISDDTWKANYGAEVSSGLNMHNFSSRGPREDGGFKPDVIAPGSAVSTVPQWVKQPDLAEAGYVLPIGYAMFNGTSMASPQAAGAAALLLDGARARDIPVTGERLRTAIYSGTRFQSIIPAAAQGRGQVDVNQAWSVLVKRANLFRYTTSAPVCSALSEFLATPNRGTGLRIRCAPDEGGLSAGQTKRYAVTVTRTNGGARSIGHRISFRGNDGTFTAPRTVSLPLNRPVRIPVTVRGAAGLHSTVIRVDRTDTPQIDHQIMASVVIAPTLTAPGFRTQDTGSVERNLLKRLFVAVPDEATSLQVDLGRIAAGSQVRFIAYSPSGVPVESTSSLACFTNFSEREGCDPNSRAYPDPEPGIWEIEVEARRTTPTLDNPYRLTAAVQGVDVTPPNQTLESVAAGEPTELEWTVANLFGPVAVTAEGGPLGSAFSDRPTIADGATEEYTVEVPEDASTFEATIGNTGDPGADLDLIVERDGEQVGISADGDSEESVTIEDPQAGTYTVIVDGYEVPNGETAYDYLDVFYSEGLGSLDVDGATQDLPADGEITVNGTLTALESPEEGRRLFGEMVVLSETGAELGSGSVIVESVGEAAPPADEPGAPGANQQSVPPGGNTDGEAGETTPDVEQESTERDVEQESTERDVEQESTQRDVEQESTERDVEQESTERRVEQESTPVS